MTSDNHQLWQVGADECRSEVRRGRELYESCQYDEARQAFERAIDIQPDDPEAAAGLAKVLIVEGAYVDAKDIYEAALSNGLEKSAEHLTNLAICYAFEGEREPARTLLEGAVAVDPSYQPAYGALARHCLIMGDYIAAERYATEGLRLFPKNVPCFEARALARLSMLDLQGAEVDAHRLLAFDPESVDGLLCQAGVLMAFGKVAESGVFLQKAEALEPQNVDVILAKGGAYQLQKKFRESEACYRQAEDLEPYNWRVYQCLASLALQSGKNERGLREVNTALGLQEAPTLHYLRGEFFVRLGRLAEAQHEFTLATQANPLDALSWIGLAEIEVRYPVEHANANAHADKAQTLAPTGSVAERAKAVLSQLRT